MMTVTLEPIYVRGDSFKWAAVMWLVVNDKSNGCFPAAALTRPIFSYSA